MKEDEAPTEADSLKSVKRKLILKQLNKHKKKEQHNSKKSKEKASFLFDPAAKLAEYVSKFEGNGKAAAANECHSSSKDVAGSSTSDTSFRSSFCLTGASNANAANRRCKKMNMGKGDAIPVQRSLSLLPSSHPCSEAERPVGQDIVRSHSIKSSFESSESTECDLLANNAEQEEMQPVLGTEHETKRHFKDEGESGAERKKKKQEVKDYKSVNCQTQEEGVEYITLSSDDAF
jgi:hypothetical protein